MRRQALDCEGPSYANNTARLVGSVIKVLDVSIARDRDVDLFLPSAARIPPLRVDRLPFGRPIVIRIARNLPFPPSLLELLVKLLKQRLQRLLPALPNHVDLGIIRDGFKPHVRNALKDK